MLTDANAHLPRIKHQRPLEPLQVAHYIKERSSYTVGDVIGMMYQLGDAALFFMRQGTPVRLEGLGILSPSLKLDGTVTITFRAEKPLLAELNRENSLKRITTHRKNIGKTLEELQQSAGERGQK